MEPVPPEADPPEATDVEVTGGLRRAALIRGNELAVIDGGLRRTWLAMLGRVSRLARALQRLGVGRGDRVAILMLNGHRYLEAYYAIPWAGAIVMPVNIRLSPLEILAQVTDAEPTVIVVDDTFVRVTANLGNQMASLRAVVHAGDGPPPNGTVGYESILAQAEPVDDARVGGDEVYGLFYTGGTTAAAKGVMLTHTNICVNAYNAAVDMQYSEKDVYMHVAPMFHLADSASTFAVTMIGGCHTFIPLFDPGRWAQAVQDTRTTRCLLVPTMVNAVVNWPGLSATDLTSLQRIVYGGAPISRSLLALAKQKLACEFQQGYGMTETSPVLTTLADCDHQLEGPNAHRIASAGRPVLNIEIAVLDDEDRPVPTGSVGEICARGPTIMKGYWRKPEETARALRNGYMHTGDLGYIDADGYVYLVDRAKDMIVTGGENVYSVEVEAALYAHPAVLEAAVFGVPHDVFGEQVHATVVLKDGQFAVPEDLMAHCRQAIAGYKCPRSVTISTAALPKSGAGKILKRDLRAQHWEGLERQIH
jgi:acyl-CoA synthetase (AMP-forming)/AMP-acid ligase II